MSSKLKEVFDAYARHSHLFKYNELLGDVVSSPHKYQLCKVPVSDMDKNDLLVAFAYLTHLTIADTK